MKNIIKSITLLIIMGVTVTSCLLDDSNLADTFNKGPNFVGFTAATVNASAIADGNESEVFLPIILEGPSSTDFNGEITVLLSVDPSSTAIEGVHYRMDSMTATISSANNNLASFPLTVITDGIDPPLDENPLLILNITEISDGSVVVNGRTSSISIAVEYLCFSDITGRYRTLDAAYYRIGSFNDTETSWPAEIEIQYICRDTYRVIEFFGWFNGNEWYFKVDPETGVITYPALTPEGEGQLGNGQPLITCQSNPAEMTNVPCGAAETNFVVRNNDLITLYMTFGYLTPGSDGNEGPREFYQVLEKL